MATGQEIYENFMAGNSEPLEFAQSFVRQVADEFEVESQQLGEAQDTLLGYWEGDSAEAAGRGVDPLIDAHHQSAPMVVTAGQSVNSQSEAFEWGKREVEPVPPEPDAPSPFAQAASAILPGVPDPTESYREGMANHVAANDKNVRVQDQYAGITTDMESQLPSDYGIVADDGAAISIGTHASSAGGGPAVGNPSVNPAGYTPTTGPGPGINPLGSGPSVGPAPGPAPTAGNLPGQAPVTGSTPPGAAPPSTNPSPGPAPVSRGGGPVVAPIGGGQANPNSDTTRRTPARGGQPGRPGNQRAGQRLTSLGPRSGGGVDPRTIARGGQAAVDARAGSNARITGGNAGLQAGKNAGGLPGGQGSAAQRLAASGAGARGGGMAPAGAAGGRGGQGEEDKEHKDKYAVKEEFDDGLQVVRDDEGAKTVDETTGNAVVNPVIGHDEEPAAPAATPDPQGAVVPVPVSGAEAARKPQAR